MRRFIPSLIVGFSLGFGVLGAQSVSEAVDFDKARVLIERQKGGGALSAGEQAYLKRAKGEFQKRQQTGAAPGAAGGGAKEEIDWQKARELFQRRQGGGKLSAEEEAFLQKAMALRNAGGAGRGGSGSGIGNGNGAGSVGGQRSRPTGPITPLSDMGATDRYEGEDGGLYGGGNNTPPEAHRRAAEAALALIRPLDAGGKADERGTIGFVSISMSNATQEFSRFKQVADLSSFKSSLVTIVDCAQGGQAMAQWVPADGRPWQEARRRLEAAHVTPQQVQVAWVKLANVAPSGSLQEHGRKLEKDTLAVLQNAKAVFPNLRIAYFASRTYGGYAVGGLNPEPYAFEGAFSARWLIQRQMQGDAELGAARSPLLLWGPYLWADGSRGRRMDSLVWNREDFGGDGVHPSESGRQKVAELLLDFLTRNPLAAPWFAKGGG